MIPQGMEAGEAAAVQEMTIHPTATPYGNFYTTPIGTMGAMSPQALTMVPTATPYQNRSMTPAGEPYMTPVGGMGQVVPPIQQNTFKWVLFGVAGLLILSVGIYLLMRNQPIGEVVEEDEVIDAE